MLTPRERWILLVALWFMEGDADDGDRQWSAEIDELVEKLGGDPRQRLFGVEYH